MLLETGGDFWTNYYFTQEIISKKQIYLGVYKGVTMSSVGILAWKSSLKDDQPIDAPNFKKKADRKKSKIITGRHFQFLPGQDNQRQVF